MYFSPTDKTILKILVAQYINPVPKKFTQEIMFNLDWKLFKEYDITLMELLQKHKQEVENNYLAIEIQKEILQEILVENVEERHLFKWNRNIKLSVD